MGQRIQSDQIVLDSPKRHLKTTTRQEYDEVMNLVDDGLAYPGKVMHNSVSGADAVIKILASPLQKLQGLTTDATSGADYQALSTVNNQFLSYPESYLNLSDGGVTGSIDLGTVPTTTAGYWRWILFSARSDAAGYAITFGDQVSGFPAYGTSMPAKATGQNELCSIRVQNSGGGTWGFLRPQPSDVFNHTRGGGGGGSGSAGASLLDPEQESLFLYYTKSDFSVERATFVASVSGATNNITSSGKVLFSTSGQTLITTELSGPQIDIDAIPAIVVQAKLLYTVDKVDNPSVQFSRDGGANYFTATTTLLTSEGNIVLANLTFTDTDPVSTDLRMKIISGTNSVSGTTELLGFGVDYVLDSVAVLTANNSIYSAIVGSGAQVAQGIAQYSTIAGAISNSPVGGNILILDGTYTENLTINSKVNLIGQGHTAVLNGTLTFGSSSDYSSVRMLRIADNITFNAGADGIFLRECWQATGKTITDNGSANSILVIQE